MKALSPADQGEIDAFCDALWLEDGLARTTLDSYRSDLGQFSRWLAESNRPTLLAADEVALSDFIAKLAGEKRSTSQARYLATLRRFYRWQLSRGRLQADPTLRLSNPQRPSRLPKVLSEAQVEALLAAPDLDTTLGQRDRAMLETIYATGLRVSELVNLQIHEIGFNEGGPAGLRQGQQGTPGPLGGSGPGLDRRLSPGPPGGHPGGQAERCPVRYRPGAAP